MSTESGAAVPNGATITLRGNPGPAEIAAVTAALALLSVGPTTQGRTAAEADPWASPALLHLRRRAALAALPDARY